MRDRLKGLAPELKAIADAHMADGNNETSALKEIMLEQDIRALPHRLEVIADMYLLQGYTRA